MVGQLQLFVCVCLCVCVFVTVCVFLPYRSHFKRNLHQTSHTGRYHYQSTEELIRFSSSWDQRSRSCRKISAMTDLVLTVERVLQHCNNRLCDAYSQKACLGSNVHRLLIQMSLWIISMHAVRLLYSCTCSSDT